MYRFGIAFHLTKKKAVLLRFTEFLDTGKKFEITRGFRIRSYEQVSEIGSFASPEVGMTAAIAERIFTNFFRLYAVSRRGCKGFHADLLLHSGRDCWKFSAQLVVVFNLILLVLSFTKILLRKWGENKKNARKIRQKSE